MTVEWTRRQIPGRPPRPGWRQRQRDACWRWTRLPQPAPVVQDIRWRSGHCTRTLGAKKLDHLDFARIAKRDFGIEAIEYVNTFFKDKARRCGVPGRDEHARCWRRRDDSG